MSTVADAEFFFKMGDIERALNIYYDITNNHPGDVNAWRGLTNAIVSTGKCLKKGLNTRRPDAIDVVNKDYYVIDEIARCLRALEIHTQSKSEGNAYVNAFLNNLAQGKIYLWTSLASLSKELLKICSKTEVSKIIKQGTDNAEKLNKYGYKDVAELCFNPYHAGKPMCVFYYGKILTYVSNDPDDNYETCTIAKIASSKYNH